MTSEADLLQKLVTDLRTGKGGADTTAVLHDYLHGWLKEPIA